MISNQTNKPIKTFLRGGQVTLHTLRMFGQVLSVMVAIMLIIMFAITYIGVMYATTDQEQYYAFKWYEAFVYSQFSDPYVAELNMRASNGELSSFTLHQILTHDGVIFFEKAFRAELIYWLGLGAIGGGGTFFLIVMIFSKRGGLLTLTNFRRGAEELKPAELKLLISQHNKKRKRDHKAYRSAPHYTLAGIPYPLGTEVQHTAISGTIGSGKTQSINDLLEQIRAHGDRAVVFDLTGSFVGPYYRPGQDVILNPLDARSPRWSIFEEARGKIGFDAIAAAMIVKGNHGEPVWADSARMVFSTAAQLLIGDNRATNEDLMRTLMTSPLGELETFFKGTPAASIISADSARMANSVRMMLSTYLDCLRLLPEVGTSFSITDWITREEEDSTLFLTSRADMHETLKPLLTVWMDTAVRALMAQNSDPTRRIWFIIDEVAALQQLPSIMDGLARGRQFGAAFVLGIQAQSQLKEIYGADGAQSLSSVCRTKLILAASDADTARWYADFLGRQETVRALENTSFGANTIRDGVSVNRQEKLEHLIIPEQIMNLKSLEGYVKMSEGFPLAKVEIPLVIRDKNNEPFIPRQDTDEIIRRNHMPAAQVEVEAGPTNPTPPGWVKPKSKKGGGDQRDLFETKPVEPATAKIIDMDSGQLINPEDAVQTAKAASAEAGPPDTSTDAGRERANSEATSAFPDHMEM